MIGVSLCVPESNINLKLIDNYTSLLKCRGVLYRYLKREFKITDLKIESNNH